MRADSLDTTRLKVGKPRAKHPDRRLSAVQVKNLQRPGRYADGNGLYLFVDDSGAKRWVLRTVVSGKRRDIGLGPVRLVPLADAREEAAKLRRQARAGGDPLAERRRERKVVPTFREAAKSVHAAHSPTFKNSKHRAQWLASLEADVFPVFGDKLVTDVDTPDVLKALTPIWMVKPETARRLRQRIRAVLDWARASGYRSGDNPVDGLRQVLPKHKGGEKHHAAMPYAKVPAFVERLRGSDASDVTRLAFEFLILTAARTSEVIGARWQEFDLEGRVWTIPGNRIKSGRQHRVPLPPRCLEILTAAKAGGGGEFVFPGRRDNKPLSSMTFLMLLRRLGHDDVTAHGFRSSFRDWAEERTTTARAAIESCLAHVVKNKVEAAYLRTDHFEARRDLMAKWEHAATSSNAKVIPISA